MNHKEVKPRSDTAEQILDEAEMLIQTRGYNAFSYQDIADTLNIRKASIHYHFPSKTILGVTVVQRYSERFSKAIETVFEEKTTRASDMLDMYSMPYIQFSAAGNKVCLCGALAGEMLALPEEMQSRIRSFFEEHQKWLSLIIRHGIKRGEFKITTSVEDTAQTIFCALQGALLVQRATKQASQTKRTIATIKAQLAGQG